MQFLNDDVRKQIIEINNIIDEVKYKIKGKECYSSFKKDIKLKVACILDEFSYGSFKDSADMIYLTPRNWKEVVESNEFDMLFVESVWTGFNDSWKYKFVNLHEETPFKINSNKLLTEIIEYFKGKYIPTIFWNKEDPIHYEEFIFVAKKFDYIFTTDSNMIDQYKKDCKHNNVFTMQFAANLKIHNPINKDIEKIGDFAFAGAWYERHEDRKRVTKEILDMFKNYDLTIYDRHFNKDTNGRNVFPEEYRKYIKGSLPYDEMIKAYKNYNIFLNVNTVLNSPTMYSRRVFELLACGTAIVTTESKGIKNDFKDIVIFSNEEGCIDGVNKLLEDKEYRDKLSVKSIRKIISKHTYEHRFNSMVDKLKINYTKMSKNKVSVIAPTNRAEFIDNIIYNYTNQSYEEKELIIIINKNDISINKVKEKVKNIKNVYIYKISEEKTLGECIEFAVEKSTYDYIAKFDDDDFYGKHYLEDMMNVFKFSDADIVGKKSIYIYYEASKTLEIKYPNTENKYIDFVSGATIVFTKNIFNKIGVESRNTGEDTSFINKCRSIGGKVYSSDRFNYIAVRRSDKSNHTWKIEDNLLKSKSEKINRNFENYEKIKEYVSV